MSASIIPFTNHRVSSSRAVTPAGEGFSSSSPSPAPLSPLECDAPTGSSTIFAPSSFQGELARRAVGRSPNDRLTDRDEIGLALYSPFRAPRDHWWRV